MSLIAPWDDFAARPGEIAPFGVQTLKKLEGDRADILVNTVNGRLRGETTARNQVA
jgi:hypothetical protein